MPTIEPQSTTFAPSVQGSRKILLIGCGSRRTLDFDATPQVPYLLTTLDVVPTHQPDIVWDLEVTPWSDEALVGFIRARWESRPLPQNHFDEIHAYEVLEHLGRQGDGLSFFKTFSEIYRLLKPGGLLVGSVPRWDKIWAWGDPTHKRIISEGSLVFLDATQYDQVGKTSMSDLRYLWKGDFEAQEVKITDDQMFFRLKAHKPSRRSDG